MIAARIKRLRRRIRERANLICKKLENSWIACCVVQLLHTIHDSKQAEMKVIVIVRATVSPASV